MSAAAAILASIRLAGGDVVVKDGRLRLTASKPLPADLIERLRQAKGEVLAFLTGAAALAEQACRGAEAYARWLETAEPGEGAP